MTTLTHSDVTEIEEQISKMCKDLKSENDFKSIQKFSNEKNLKNLIEALVEKRVNKRLAEEIEKYEECLKKLESDIRKHIQIENEMKLHIDCLEEKLLEFEYYKEENFELKEKLKELNFLKNENFSLLTLLKQNEENMNKLKIKLNELEDKSKGLSIPVNKTKVLNKFKSKLTDKNLQTIFNFSSNFVKNKNLFDTNHEKVSLTRGNSRGNIYNPLKYNLFSTNKEEGKFTFKPPIHTSIDNSTEKSIFNSNLNDLNKKKINLKDTGIKEKIKNFHIPSRSLNQSSLNNYMSHNLFKSKINLK